MWIGVAVVLVTAITTLFLCLRDKGPQPRRVWVEYDPPVSARDLLESPEKYEGSGDGGLLRWTMDQDPNILIIQESYIVWDWEE